LKSKLKGREVVGDFPFVQTRSYKERQMQNHLSSSDNQRQGSCGIQHLEGENSSTAFPHALLR
jgi:hypothetical protein